MAHQADLVRSRLLRSLPASELVPLLAKLEYCELQAGTDLQPADDVIEHVYFVESGMVSVIVTLQDGDQVEIGLIGREGICGVETALGVQSNGHRAFIQVAGAVRRMPRSSFSEAVEAMPALRKATFRYIDAFLLQVSQVAVCNTCHPIEKRLSRWLLSAADRIEQDAFPVTQHFIAAMLGVQRPSVTLAVRTLHRAGLIDHDRRGVRICDRDGLVAFACECYSIMRRKFECLSDMEHHDDARKDAAIVLQ